MHVAARTRDGTAGPAAHEDAVSDEPEHVRIELEHAIGFSGYVPNSLFLSNGGNSYLHTVGGSLVVSDMNDPHRQSFFQGHDDDITCVAVSKSGRLVASGQAGTDSDVVVWDMATKKLVYRFEEHDHGIQSVAFSHDERLLATLGIEKDKKLIIWDLATGMVIASMRNASFRSISFGGMVKNVKRRDTECYQLAAAGEGSATLFSLNPFDGNLEQRRMNCGSIKRSFTCLAFSQDYEHIYAGSNSGDVSVFSVKDACVVGNFFVCRNGVCALRVSDDPQESLHIGGGDGTLSVWSKCIDYYGKISFRKVNETRVDGQITSVSIRRRSGRTKATASAPSISVSSSSSSSDEMTTLVGTAAGYILRSDESDSRGFRLVSENHSDAVEDLAYASNTSDRFVTCSRDRTVRIWNASDYSVTNKALVRGAGAPSSVCLSIDHIFSGWADGKIRCHAASDGTELWSIAEAHKVVRDSAVRCMRLSNNEKFILSGGEDGAVRVWEVRRKQMITHLKEHKSRVSQIALFDDDTHAVSCSQDRSFLCWDLRAERRISTHTQRTGGINSVALSCDQTVVITCGKEQSVTFWDLRESDPVRSIYPAHNGEATCIAVMRSNQHIFATSGTDARIKIWDMRTCRNAVSDGVGHAGVVNKCMFSPDDKQLVSIGEDGGVFVWNFATGKRL